MDLPHTRAAAADYDILLPHLHTRPVVAHKSLQHHDLVAAGDNLLLRIAVAGSSHPAGVGAECPDMVAVRSLDSERHKGLGLGVEKHRIAVEPGIVAAERRDLVGRICFPGGGSHLGRLLVELVEHRRGGSHRIAAAAAVGVGRNPVAGRPGVEQNRSSRFQTLSEVYCERIILLDRGREPEGLVLGRGFC